jgi:formamidopyrimidine-DNA glycosylase
MANEDEHVKNMLEKFKEVKEHQKKAREQGNCSNCEEITESTRVTAKDRGNKTLHYCANCQRLLSNHEYNRWKALGGY